MTSTQTLALPTATIFPLLRIAARDRVTRLPAEVFAEQEDTRGAGEPPVTRPTLGRHWGFARDEPSVGQCRVRDNHTACRMNTIGAITPLEELWP